MQGAASYYNPANRYVNLVRSGPKRTRGDVIDVLTVAYAKVRSLVSGRQVRALVDRPQDSTSVANERDCRRGRLASCHAIGGELTSGCLRLSAVEVMSADTTSAP